MTYREHNKLHRRLRKEGKCNISAKELHKISTKARRRTQKYRDSRKEYANRESTKQWLKSNSIDFYTSFGDNIRLHETILYFPKTGNVSYISRFSGCNKNIINIEVN